MNIKQSKTKDLMAVISVEVSVNDYSEKVEKALQGYRKTAEIPGFRKGKVPMGIINKKYRTSIVVDEVNKLLQDELYKYITSEKIRVLGSPMPLDTNEVDWEKTDDFIFKYEIGLAPDFEVKITSKDKLNYYKIKADSKLVDGYCNDIAKKYGKMSNPEVSVDGDLVFCIIEQLDQNGGILSNGIKHEATVSMDFISDSKIKNKFIGLKANSFLTVNVLKAFTNHADLAAMLNVEQVALNSLVSEEFKFTVKNINRLEPASLDIDLSLIHI